MRWWAFEGFTQVDCCLETDNLLLFIEGKRKESLSSATMWFKQRSQLIRNLEVCLEAANGKYCGVLLIVEDGDDPFSEALLRKSLPHLVRDEEVGRVESVYMGCTTWREVCAATGVRFDDLPRTTDEAVARLKREV